MTCQRIDAIAEFTDTMNDIECDTYGVAGFGPKPSQEQRTKVAKLEAEKLIEFLAHMALDASECLQDDELNKLTWSFNQVITDVVDMATYKSVNGWSDAKMASVFRRKSEDWDFDSIGYEADAFYQRGTTRFLLERYITNLPEQGDTLDAVVESLQSRALDWQYGGAMDVIQSRVESELTGFAAILDAYDERKRSTVDVTLAPEQRD